MNDRARSLFFAGIVASAITAIAACSAPDASARFVASPPDRASFAPVAQVFVRTCGTLDCHGTVARNFKIYGDIGLRASPSDRPSVLTPTTNEEVDRTYASFVGLEPETLSAVVTSGGASPERLTFLRKARGTEHHKPGPIITQGDDRDVCFTSWLAGHTDAGACTRALSYP
jgi:hypothetical protein